jgi:hypothetical protein
VDQGRPAAAPVLAGTAGRRPARPGGGRAVGELASEPGGRAARRRRSTSASEEIA